MFPKTNFFALITLLIATIVSGGPTGFSPKPKFDGRIVGGFPISIKTAPYQVSLQYTEPGRSKTQHFCGGSIINEKFILTAGHCTEDLKRDELIVAVGSSFYDRDFKKINVERIINHENYNTRTQDYDVALLELSENLEFSDSIKPIALPNDNEMTNVGTMCLVSGWGDKKSFMVLRKTELRAVEVPIINQNKCNNNYRMYGGITSRMICAGFDKGGKDACQGDSGGPLACGSKARSGNETTILTGVVSWGNECAEPGFPGVYADVRMLRSWIRKQTGL